MEIIKQWALSLCVAAVAGAAAEMILPEGSLQKVFKITFSVFFLCCLFSPALANVKLDMSYSETALTETESLAGELESSVNRQITDSAAASVEKLAQKELEAMGIFSAKTAADINIAEDGGILINRLQITLPAGTGASPDAV